MNSFRTTRLRQVGGATAACAALLLTGACTLWSEDGSPSATGLPAPDAAELSTAPGPTTAPPPAGGGGSTPTPPGASTGTGAGTGTGTNTASRSVEVPASAMLRPADWPKGEVRDPTTGVAKLEQTEPSACQARTAYPSDRHRQAARTVSIGSDEPESGGVHQIVVRYAPGRGLQAMAEMRRVLTACRGYRSAPDWTRRYALESQRFAGDDALLVRIADRQDGTTRDWADYVSVVRLGDALVTTVSAAGEGVADVSTARRLAAVGARRAACLRSTC